MDQEQADTIVDTAVAEGGAYEVIRKRLVEQGQSLSSKTGKLNAARLSEFGASNMEVNARVRVRTENNCVARDIVQVGDLLLFGYNVFIGLKKETQIADVFALFRVNTSEGFKLEPIDNASSFLSLPGFVNDFDELYRYYKHTKLIQLTINHGHLLAGFQIGERLEDIRVFRWALNADGTVKAYIDNRGERDIQLPPAYDFEWITTTRDDAENGRHPHVNIADTIFVETVGGDLTIKIENNTEDGLGIYREPVEDTTQSLDDAQIAYAQIGNLTLLKIRPYKEPDWRYLIFNALTEDVLRVDRLGESCVQLPENQGIIFPGGYYLETGEYKTFDEEVTGLKFKRSLRSPNGEDVLYIFYEPEAGAIGLFPYNLISKELQNPIYGHGYARAEDGTVVIFSAEHEATRVHPMQVWQTPFETNEHASKAPESQSFFGRIGNAELVRGISNLFGIAKMIGNQSVSLHLYEELSKAASKIFDAHYWLEDDQVDGIDILLKEITNTCELVIDEFEKVESIRKQSQQTMAEAEKTQASLLLSVRPDNWELVEHYVTALASLRRQQGHLITIKDHRYIDTNRIDELAEKLKTSETSLSAQTVVFLSQESALTPYIDKIDKMDHEIEQAESTLSLDPIIELIGTVAAGLDLLSELMTTLKVADARMRTQIIDAISEVYSKLNQAKARASNKRKGLGSDEAVAQFGAQFKLFSQSITNALGMATSPEKCDEQLSRLLVQLEEFESQFGDFDQFLNDIIDKREEVYESFETHKQHLLDEQQRKALNIADAASRIISGIEKRSLKFTESDTLNTYFASDSLVLKVRDLVSDLRDLSSVVRADEIEARFLAAKEQALRSLRDKSDIFEDGGKVIKLGPRHRFSVNTQELDLTILPRNDQLQVHLTGTNYYEALNDETLVALKDYWDITLESETADVYRAEYLAYQVLETAVTGKSDFTLDDLRRGIKDNDKLSKIVRAFANPRYKEGYEKGIHDHDACLILKQLIPLRDSADLLRFDPLSRAICQIFWVNTHSEQRASNWQHRAVSASALQSSFASNDAMSLLKQEVEVSMHIFIDKQGFALAQTTVKLAAEYLCAEMARDQLEFIGSKQAGRLMSELKQVLDETTYKGFSGALNKLKGKPLARWQLSIAWITALVKNQNLETLTAYIPEAVAMINCEQRLERRLTEVDSEMTINGLLGEHILIQKQSLQTSLDNYLLRMSRHQNETIPAYHKYQTTKQAAVNRERSKLRLDEFKAKPLSSFVRNRLINESYLPLIGDNLAKQMGTVGDSKRTDLMGLLMMISPPGYGKTTLMEYTASRLGLIFMKINCPSLGHEVMSLDPEQAPNATARQELHKINLAFEMGNNVMLYLDDIQHTHPEFLQKFISLCDGTRRIEGVWRGETKTYDMRGRKFCVVMAGNPYTESGESFQVPDMLANRADIYNLGDILGGMEEQFALSYIENAMTSNSVLAPLALREADDIYNLIKIAQGIEIPTTDLKHQYSGAEVNEITGVLKKMFVVQEVILKINQQYIQSAAQDDKYRIEPSFKLQGSYRNMNKMTEKLSAIMNEDELQQLIADHYLGEAQLLTTGAEANLLKLSELRGTLNSVEDKRWQQIRDDFKRNKSIGGDDAEVGDKVVAQLVDLVNGMDKLADFATQPPAAIEINTAATDNSALLTSLADVIEKLGNQTSNEGPNIEVINQPVPGINNLLQSLADTMEHSIYPLVRSMDKKMDIDLRTHNKLLEISNQLRQLGADAPDE